MISELELLADKPIFNSLANLVSCHLKEIVIFSEEGLYLAEINFSSSSEPDINYDESRKNITEKEYSKEHPGTIAENIFIQSNQIQLAVYYLPKLCGSDDGNQEIYPHINTILEGIINHEYEYDSLIVELEDRYNELNLAYEVENKSPNFQEIDKLIVDMIKNSCECLDIDNAVIESFELPINHQIFSNDKTDRGLFHPVVKKLAMLIEEPSDIFVINNTKDEKKYSVETFGNKIIFCPIFNSNKKFVSFMLFSRLMQKNKFSNSDKNMIKVVAKRIAKFIDQVFDSQTNTVKRKYFDGFVNHTLKNNASLNNLTIAIVDTDALKVINESIGFAHGNKVIFYLKNIIQTKVRQTDIISHFGAGRFCVFLPNCDYDSATRVCASIRSAVEEQIVSFENEDVTSTVSIGAVSTDNKFLDADNIINYAEMALQEAKSMGGNQIKIHALEDDKIKIEQSQLRCAQSIKHAIKNDRLELFAQKIVGIGESTRKENFEILLRMYDDLGHMIMPGDFITAAEKFYLMNKIDRWVVSKTIQMLSQNKAVLEKTGFISVNISGHSICDAAFLNFVCDQIANADFDVSHLCFELTESVAVDSYEDTVKFMNTVQSYGCSVALDDFGVGMSSFAYLKDFPIDHLKIDGSFIKDIMTNPVSHYFVKSIREVANVLNISVVAEFVENEETADFLSSLNIDYLQGYLFGKPEPLISQLKTLRINDVESLAARKSSNG